MAKPAARTPTSAVTAPSPSPSSAVAVVPDFMRDQIGAGMENIGAGDIETPRVKLLQALSPELKEFNEAQQGHFWHSLANEDLGTTLSIIPLYVDQRAILWNPRDQGGGILARADDGIHWVPPNVTYDVKIDKGKKAVRWTTRDTVAASRLLEWGSSDPDDPNSPPAATRMYNIVVAMPQFPHLPPSVITLQRSAIRSARKFLGQLRLIRAPTYGTVFNMRAVDDTNSVNQDFFNFAFNPAGFVTDHTKFETYRGYYEAFRQMGLQIRDLETIQGDSEEIHGNDTAEDNKADDKPSY